MREKLNTRLSYVYSAILVISGTASSKASDGNGDGNISGEDHDAMIVMMAI